MDAFHSDFLIQILSFLNVIDSTRLAETSKRFYYLVHQFRTLSGPQLVAATPNREENDSFKTCVKQLRSPPNLALMFATNRANMRSMLEHEWPPSVVYAGAVSNSVQANIQGSVDSTQEQALMLGSFPSDRTHLQSFWIEMTEDENDLSFVEGEFQRVIEEFEASPMPWIP